MKVWWGEDVPEFGSSLDISTLYVHRDFHHRGIGSELVRWAVRASRQYGCESLTVWPNEEQAAPPVLCIVAQTAAYKHGAGWLEELLEYLDGNISLALEFL